MFRQCYLLQGTRLNTVKNVRSISSRARLHTLARATCDSVRRRASKQKVSDSLESKVLIKTTRIHSPIFKNQLHLLLLTVFLVG